MLRRPLDAPDLVQHHADQDHLRPESTSPDHGALLRLLGHAAPMNYVQPDSHSFSDVEKSSIYTEWISKPHNLVCSECRHPDDLLLCETCCRSYHARCLPGATAATASLVSFHCPSCKEKQWDQTPPPVNPLVVSPSASRSSTPSGSAMSMSPRTAIANRRAPVALGSGRSALQSPSLPSSPDAGGQPHPGVPNGSASPSSDMVFRARQFLIQQGHFPASQDFRPDLLLKLGSMMVELDAQQRLLQELRELREENAALRSDLLNTKKLFGTRMPVFEPILNPPVASVSPAIQPPADTTGKSWDRIVMDLL
ncbi:PHD finger protein [Aspergillus clavatus NRRL 1]|uniref:PHD finger domain protein n=1 Tax=Aspergillus clavatus (strain ATCC 1007 / CBS 513.65 / DSM 816 / NCTC 3887 / NRRL 1 / QM 1276 / 107) TaxID=344612 RepID=A1CUL9_ASPCL|nr:PHD finger domain protein [Aspergillus clavatus NRRL 1]EAW07006.1 PHD finger domain protein [Aspergillus clavatus NRRL 1]